MNARRILRELLFEPQVMMLFGPVEIDVAGSHRLECAFHPKRADIDVAEDQRDKQNADNAVHHLRDLHPEDVRDVEWEEQQEA